MFLRVGPDILAHIVNITRTPISISSASFQFVGPVAHFGLAFLECSNNVFLLKALLTHNTAVRQSQSIVNLLGRVNFSLKSRVSIAFLTLTFLNLCYFFVPFN